MEKKGCGCGPQFKNQGTAPLSRAEPPNFQQHYGWNPVYWSDYPKQPMWTVPLPKIPAPVSVPYNFEPPRPPCLYPPPVRAVRPGQMCPYWEPGMPHPLPAAWNSLVNENNIPFSNMVGPKRFV